MKKFLALAVLLWALLGGTASAQNYDVDGSLDVDVSTIEAGDTVTVTGGGFAPGSTVTICLDVDGAEGDLGTATADDDGNISVEITIPADFAGSGVLLAKGTTADGGTRELGIRISGGQVEQLAFTGTSSSTSWLVTVAIGSIAAGGLLLILRNARLTQL